jgi:hypothetical protein
MCVTAMSDADARVVALLEELVDLQKTANEQQRQAVQKNEQYYVDARARTETAIELQKAAVERQRWFVRVWLGLIVFIVASAAGLLIVVSRHLL